MAATSGVWTRCRSMRSVCRVCSAAALVLLLVPATALASARKPAKRPTAVCSVPRGAKVVAQNPQYRLIVIHRLIVVYPSPPANVREWRYCLRKPGQRFHVLVNESGGIDTVEIRPVVLSGAYAAFDMETTPQGGKYGYPPVGVLTVRDLRTGKSRSTGIRASAADPPPACGFCVVGPTSYYCTPGYACPPNNPTLVLAADGLAAWDAEGECPYYHVVSDAWRACEWGIQVLDGRTGWTGLLDSLPRAGAAGEYQPNPFTGLQITHCVAGCTPADPDFVTWERSGTRHFVAVP